MKTKLINIFKTVGIGILMNIQKSDIDKILSNEFGKEVNCFGDNQWIDDTPADSVRIRDQFAKDSTLPKYVVMLDVRS